MEKEFYRQWRENREMVNGEKKCVFKNAQFVIYNPDGVIEKVDTIREAIIRMI